MINKFFYLIEKILRWFLERICKVSITENKLQALIEFVKFGVIGLSNTLISYLIYVLALFGFQSVNIFPKIDYLIAQVIGFILSVLWSFYWNNIYVFKEEEKKRNWFQALIKTYISYAFTGLFLNSLLSMFWVEILHWSKMVSPIINLLVSVPLNFIMNKFWAFKSR
ncbi:MAG: GtrA family protein [Tyzzerella sp.]|nr:GtrA family protein [Tyzzerella sp.]